MVKVLPSSEVWIALIESGPEKLHHHREADDLRRGLEVAENTGAVHAIEGNCTRPGSSLIFL